MTGIISNNNNKTLLFMPEVQTFNTYKDLQNVTTIYLLLFNEPQAVNVDNIIFSNNKINNYQQPQPYNTINYTVPILNYQLINKYAVMYEIAKRP